MSFDQGVDFVFDLLYVFYIEVLDIALVDLVKNARPILACEEPGLILIVCFSINCHKNVNLLIYPQRMS